LFILFSQDGSIDKDDFAGKYLIFPMGSKERTVTSEAPKRPSISYDPIKEMMKSHGLIRSSSIIETKRQSVSADLSKQDTVVGQYIRYLYISYMSLRDAFHQIDRTGTGSLTKSEFTEGLQCLKVGQKNMLEMHTDDLFDRCDRYLKGRITIKDMLEEGAEDPLIQRMVTFLADPRKDFKSSSNQKDLETQQEQHLAQTFGRLNDRDKPMNVHEFVTVLKRTKYIDWHASDLFRRLNKDVPGRLSAAEFTVYLENTEALDSKEKVAAETTSKLGRRRSKSLTSTSSFWKPNLKGA